MAVPTTNTSARKNLVVAIPRSRTLLCTVIRNVSGMLLSARSCQSSPQDQYGQGSGGSTMRKVHLQQLDKLTDGIRAWCGRLFLSEDNETLTRNWEAVTCQTCLYAFDTFIEAYSNV